MLENLESVPWGRLQHAYGPAGDVPGLLRDLAAGDTAARDRAVWELRGNIWHQGTVYEATAHAVPFLVEIAAARDPVPAEIRAHVLLLLMDISRGHSYLDVHGPLLRDDVSDDERLKLERELGWVAAARDEVRAQLPTLLALLDEESPAIQTAAAGIASQFPEDASSRLSRVEQLRASSSGPANGLYELLGSLLLGRPVSQVLMQKVASTSEDVADYLEDLRETAMTSEEQALAVAAELAERSVSQALGL